MNNYKFPTRMFLIFAILSAADFTLTWHLLSRDGAFYEANPVANWWLARFGWMGLAAFKVSAVATAAGLAAVVGLRRPKAARNLLAFGSVVVGAVVIYSGSLSHKGPRVVDASDPADVARYAEFDSRMDDRIRKNEEYRATLNRIGREVVAGRLSLAEATDQLAWTEQAQDPSWLRVLEYAFPQLDPKGKLAAIIVQNALRQPSLYSQAIREIERMKLELRRLCGVDVVLEYEVVPSVADADSAVGAKSAGA